jgi:hypothetical protein
MLPLSTTTPPAAQLHGIGAPAGTTSNETLLATSAGIVDDFSCPSQTGGVSFACRWGDYSGASTDPLGGNAVWGTAELTDKPDTLLFNPVWKTENFELLA